MLRSYLAAALNNLARNRLYAAISILGLAVGMAAAILTGLYIRDELGFDRFIPGHQQLYVAVFEGRFPGRGSDVVAWTPGPFATWIKLDFPGVEATRLNSAATGAATSLRHGDVEALEAVATADPNFFSLFRLPILAGDPVAALSRPDGVVLTRSVARKFFGKDAPLGETLELNRTTPLRVGAVIADLPANTSLVSQVFTSSLSARQRAADAVPYPTGKMLLVGRSFVRVKNAAAAAAINAAMPDFIARHMMGPGWAPGMSVNIRLVPLNAFHFLNLHSGGGASAVDTEQGDPTALGALALIAALIVLIAGINFVNLMTARAGRRAVEVGVRKVAGAERRDLIVQFIGEAVVHALVALFLAVVLVELMLPGARAVLDRPLTFAYWRDPVLLLALPALALALGGLAGVYPALVQSSFRPVQVLKGGLPVVAGGVAIREGLVVVQFAVLIALILSAMTITRQLHFAMNEALRLDKDAVLTIDMAPPPAGLGPPRFQCEGAFTDTVRGLAGVRTAACTSRSAMDTGRSLGDLFTPAGAKIDIAYIDVGYGFFELFGLKPAAGRFFSRSFGGDAISPNAFGPRPIATNVIVNQAAVRAMQMGPPGAVVGKVVRLTATGQPGGAVPVTIVGVVPDFGFDLLHEPMNPRVYGVADERLALLDVKLDGRRIPETLQAIDQAWKRYGQPRAINRRFVDDYLQTVYLGVIRQGLLIDAACGVAVFVAALGLFGLAAFTAERRTKEIGVRKAMGASTADILKLLMWQFTRPVLWANLIAWPLAWWAMQRWLHGFSARIALQPWLFLAASAAALAIAWAVVLAHTLKVAAEKPVNALRYE